MNQVFNITAGDERAKFYMIQAIKALPTDKAMTVTIAKETRTAGNNRQQWPILNAIADQVMWPVNGVLTKISGDEFKQILTAAWRNETVRIAQGVGGGLVMLGHKTREFKRDEWQEWQEYIEWFAAEKGVKIPMRKSDAARYER